MDRRSLLLWCAALVTAAAAAGAAFAAGPPENPVAVPYLLQVPGRGVKLTGGVLKTAFDNNVNFLLNNFAEDDLLYVFRERAGQRNPPGKPFGWDKGGPRVTGSVAGLFLMGSGNVLRWDDSARLRARMDAVVAGMKACRAPNGFMMGYPEKGNGAARERQLRAFLD